jgi:hypothetical protein
MEVMQEISGYTSDTPTRDDSNNSNGKLFLTRFHMEILTCESEVAETDGEDEKMQVDDADSKARTETKQQSSKPLYDSKISNIYSDEEADEESDVKSDRRVTGAKSVVENAAPKEGKLHKATLSKAASLRTVDKDR